MTNITYEPYHNSIICEGHAESGEIGTNIVCASVSVLMQTLSLALEYFDIPAEEQKTPGVNPVHSIKAAPSFAETSRCKTIFDTIAVGLATLAADEPDKVSFFTIDEEGDD